jgi:hypothetical protein
MQAHFEGRLTTRDAKRHIPHPFDVPAGAGTLEITFRFAPVEVRGFKNLLTLTLFDARGETPAGFRGAGHRDGDPLADDNACAHHVCLSATGATPGYIPGPLPAGRWTVEIDTHMIMPGPPVTYTLDIAVAKDGRSTAEGAPASRSPQAVTGEPGWYRCDLHTHTAHSDAAGFAVADLARAAADVGLDFVFLTDHNTTSGLAEWPDTSPVLLGQGLELTTYWGHALCLGTRDWIDWRVMPGTSSMAGTPSMPSIAAELEAAGGVFVIAHPGSVGDPACTGCAWRYGEMMPAGAHHVEVWNGPWAGDSGNESALALWYDWLNQGCRLTATAGTDTHGSGAYASNGTEGLPGFTLIHAGGRTEQQLLEGLRRGRCYLSAGPRVSFTARCADGTSYEMGEALTGAGTLTLTWEAVPPGAQGRLLANGRLLDTWPCTEAGGRTWPLTPDTADWLVAEIRDPAGHMLALTNPIYMSLTAPRRPAPRRPALAQEGAAPRA